MKVFLTNKYKALSNTVDYPMAGFWYSILDLKGTKYESAYTQFYNNSLPATTNRTNWIKEVLTPTSDPHYYPSLSSFRKARVLINDGSCKVSLTLPSLLKNKNVYLILLYAIDLLRYPDYDITEGGTVSDMDYIMNIDNISIVVANPTSDEVFVNSSTNIIDLKHLPACSMITNLNTDAINIHDSHFMGSMLDRALYSDARYNEMKGGDKFIESVTGNELAREKQGTSEAKRLAGTMTIRTNGIVEL